MKNLLGKSFYWYIWFHLGKSLHTEINITKPENKKLNHKQTNQKDTLKNKGVHPYQDLIYKISTCN